MCFLKRDRGVIFSTAGTHKLSLLSVYKIAEFCQPSKMIGYRFTNKNKQAKYSVNKKQQCRKELLSNTLNRSTNTLFITPFVSSLDFIYRESKIIRVKGYKLFKLWTADHIHALYTSEIQDSLHSNHTVLIHKRMLKGTCGCAIITLYSVHVISLCGLCFC